MFRMVYRGQQLQVIQVNLEECHKRGLFNAVVELNIFFNKSGLNILENNEFKNCSFDR